MPFLLKTSVFEERFHSIFGFSLDQGKQFLVKSGTHLVLAIIVLVVGWWIAKWAGRAVSKVLVRSKTDAGLVTFLSSLTTIALKTLVVVTSITQLGVQMTSFVAILGAAGLAVGMAFSGTLSNFAGGVMILLFKPFKVGDTILALTHEGKVTEIQIFYTYLNTADNKVVILPNGPLANGNLVNFTREKKRRVEWVFVLDPEANYVLAHQRLIEIVTSNKLVLPKPAPAVELNSIQDGAPHVLVRAWVNTADKSDVFFDVNNRVYEDFKQHQVQFYTPN